METAVGLQMCRTELHPSIQPCRCHGRTAQQRAWTTSNGKHRRQRQIVMSSENSNGASSNGASSSNGAYMNGTRLESPFTLDGLDTPPPEPQQKSSAAPQESENNTSSQRSMRHMDAPRGGDTMDSMDASDLWLDAADAIFPKQQAQTALPPVSPVPGRTKRHKQGLKHTLLTAAPACTLEIPKQKSEEEVWNALRKDAAGREEAEPMLSSFINAAICWRKDAAEREEAEPMLSSFINAAICSQRSLPAAVAFTLAHRLADVNEEDELTTMFCMFTDALAGVRNSTLADLQAVRQRDEACTSVAMALLYHGGFHALQLQRVAHCMWESGNITSALRIQSLTSRALGADLHPAARFGKGVFIAHPLGIVVGEAARVGDHVTIMQHVTLGGTGNERGDRHPKIGNHVQIGVKATILGNILVGARARVAAGSMVLKPVAEDVLVAGNPAKVIGKLVDVGKDGHHVM